MTITMTIRKPKPRVIILSIITLLGVLSFYSCSRSATVHVSPATIEHIRKNGVYYWRTVFDLSDIERDFLKREHVGRMYLRMFDVTEGYYMPKPNASLTFATSVPQGIEVVPTVFITVGALKQAADSDMIDDLAERIVKRVSAMCSWNGIDSWREIQLDCDWTNSTQGAFYKLCKEVKHRVGERLVSSTIRLHQLTSDAPPVDYGVLMVYNTDRFDDFKTSNSILNVNTVRAYLKKRPLVRIPLDIALPIFQWDIVFRDETFVRISKSHGRDVTKGETVRHEQVDIKDILKTQQLLHEYLNLEHNGYSTILYHLDSTNIKNYSYEDIKSVYNN